MKKLYLIIVFLCACIFGHPFVFAEGSKDESVTRYMSIVIDNSLSMEGQPLDYEKQATIDMLNNLKKSKDNNFVSLIAMHGSSTEISSFTNDIDSIIDKVNTIVPEWSTNYSDALSLVSTQFDSIAFNQNIKKVLFFCSDGVPVTGEISEKGKFDSVDNISYFRYGNRAIELTNELKEKGVSVYTLGFFHALNDSDKMFGEKLLSLMATDDNYYMVSDISKLSFKFGEVIKDILNENGYFKYASVNRDNKDESSFFVYSDKFFDTSSYYYNNNLSKISLSLAMSAFGSKEKTYSDKSTNLKSLFESMKFKLSNFMENYSQKPTTDSIAAGVANKKIKVNGEDVTLIALAVRGAGYEAEWTSNLTVGKDGGHSGFEKAKNDVREFLINYIKENQIGGKVKFWITGFSRAAATSNLLAASVIDNPISNLDYSSEDVYGYTFETPAGTTDSNHSADKYSGIFNIVNRNDVVPRVAPRQWGFYRYGQDLYLPTRTSTSTKIYNTYEKQMLGIYGALNEGSLSYLIDDFRFQGDRLKKTDMVAFMNDFISLLSKKVISSRDVYYQNFEQDIRYLASTYFSLSEKDKNVFVDALLARLNDLNNS